MSASSTLAPGMSPGSTEYVISEAQQATYEAWAIDESWSSYIYNAWYAMYGFTIIPSVFAMPFIIITKAFVNIYLLVDMILKILGLGFHPARENFIWTMDNWWGYSFRRWIIDYFLTPMHFFTQAIPFVNWMLNLLTIFSYWANVMIF